jgi:hypothetical protein
MKIQNPNEKGSAKLQYSISKPMLWVWHLVLDVSLELGAWFLGLFGDVGYFYPALQ